MNKRNGTGFVGLSSRISVNGLGERGPDVLLKKHRRSGISYLWLGWHEEVFTSKAALNEELIISLIFQFVSKVNFSKFHWFSQISSIFPNFVNYPKFRQFLQISRTRNFAQEPFQVVLATREYPFPFLLSAKHFIKFSVVCFQLHRSWLHRLFMFGCSAFSLNLRVSRPTVIMINKTNSRAIAVVLAVT